MDQFSDTQMDAPFADSHVQRAGRPRGLRILIAEDTPGLQKLIALALRQGGHSVEPVSDGPQAVELATRERFDVVLMDVQMPTMNGLDATAAIRRFERSAGHHTPVIAMTAHAMPGDRERCLAAGMDGYLAKPLDLRTLDESIRGFIESAPGASDD